MSTLALGLTGKQAGALASVGQAAASTDPTLPALHTVKITTTIIDDGCVVEAVATDRFVAARIRFTLPTDVTDGRGTFIITTTQLTEIAKAAKKYKGNDVAVVISVHHDGRYTVEYWDGVWITSDLPKFDYPPVEKLIPDTTADLFDIPAGSAMNPALLARAAKLKHPDDTTSTPAVFWFYQTKQTDGGAVPWLLTRRDGDVQLVAMGARND